MRDRYLDRCATVGHQVTVTGLGGHSCSGRAVDVDADGRLVLDTGIAVAAGDVEHVRTAGRVPKAGDCG